MGFEISEVPACIEFGSKFRPWPPRKHLGLCNVLIFTLTVQMEISLNSLELKASSISRAVSKLNASFAFDFNSKAVH
jgi:hypothetical protein